MISHPNYDELKESNAAAKFIVKKWEDAYQKTHGSRPSKEALHQAPNEIKDAYKTYWRTSRQLSLLKREKICSLDPENEANSQQQIKITVSCNTNTVDESIKETRKELDYDKDTADTKVEVTDEPDSGLQNIWGKHLNKSNTSHENVNLDSSLYSQMAKNMKNHAVIKTRTSLKRLPSKPLNEKKDIVNIQTLSKSSEISDSEAVKNISNSNDFPNSKNSDTHNQFLGEDFEKVNEVISPERPKCVIKKSIRKVNSYSVSHVSLRSGNNNHMSLSRQWNEGWVKRCIGLNEITDNRSINNFNLTDSREHFLDNDIKIKTQSRIDSYDSQVDQAKDIANDSSDPADIRQAGVPEANINLKIGEVTPRKRKLSESDVPSFHSTRLKQFKSTETKCQAFSETEENKEEEHDLKHCDLNLEYSDDNNEEVRIPDDVNCSDNFEEVEVRPKRRKKQRQQKANSPQKRKRRGVGKTREVLPREDVEMTEASGTKVPANKEMPEEYDEICDMEEKPIKNLPPRKYMSKEERFHHKVVSGKVNDNFVKINLKKKVFVRGKKRMTSEKFKRQEWKKRQVMKSAEAGDERAVKKLTCFRCGEFGHWANKCPGKIGDKLLPVTEYDENESTFLTVEEAANLARGVKAPSESMTTRLYDKKILEQDQSCLRIPDQTSEDEIFSDWEEEFMLAVEVDQKPDENLDNKTNKDLPSTVPSLFNGNSGITVKEVEETLKLFGYETFRRGQEKAIMRILSGQSTLVVQSTGSGKSLCYQLPAYLYAKHLKSITLCISPLVSLMEDQVTGLPPFLKAICLHTQQSSTNREKALKALRSGNVHILLVSPEAIVSSRGTGVLGTLLKELPPIAFACLDEAHCLSEWSHNFRPSYLQVCKILKEKLNVSTLLGLTATARNETITSIAKHLDISSFDEGIIVGTSIPDNLKLSVSRDVNREEALIHLLRGDRFQGCASIIVYCTRREECERIATFIRTQLLSASRIDVKSNAKRKRGVSMDAEAYHAGLSGYRRQQIQKRFMNGQLRIVVATVAFGMGIDKADVEGIIHFNMPRNLESYAQEIGRAGRNGNTAHCHLFLDSAEGKDIQELKRHIFANSVDRFTVRKLLNKIFVPHSCIKAASLTNFDSVLNNNSGKEEKKTETYQEADPSVNSSKELVDSNYCPGHEVALPLDELVEALDLPEENIQTLLCYLESHPNARLKLSHHVYATCKVSCYSGPKQLCAVSRKCPPLAVAVALQRKKGKTFDNVSSITFPVVDISSQMGWQSRIVKQELKKLEWNTSALKTGGNVRSSGVRVEFSDLAFHLTCRCDLTEEEQDQVLEDIYERACRQERDQLKQLQFTYEVLRQASNGSNILCCDTVDEEKSLTLKEKIGSYFSASSGGLSSVHLEEQLYLRPEVEQRIRADIRSLLSIHSDQSWTGRAVARVLHGISSPNFHSKVWGRVRRFWRLHLGTDFNLLVAIATKEILKFK